MDKLMLRLRDREVVLWAVQALDACAMLDQVVVVVSENNLERMTSLFDGLPTRASLDVILGGPRRQDSVRRAVEYLERDAPELVLVHDGARPLVSPELLTRCLEAARADGAATAGLKPVDSLKEVGADGTVRRSLDRASMVAVQTPQAFRFAVLARAHRAGVEQGAVVDDDAELVERLGMAVRVIDGEARNLKITTPDDLALLEAHLAAVPG